MAKKSFYVVWKGHTPGIYTSWADCEKQVKGFSGASFRGFTSEDAAKEAFANGSDSKPEDITPATTELQTEEQSQTAPQGAVCEYF